MLFRSATVWPIQAAGDTSDTVILNAKIIPLSSADLKETRVGDLIYRGGLQIRSPDARFGGWSGLLVSADGKRMLSQSDEGHWLRANLVYDKRGNLVGIANGELADMQALDGSKLGPKQEADAEGLAALSEKGRMELWRSASNATLASGATT